MFHVPEDLRITNPNSKLASTSEFGNNGAFAIRYGGVNLTVIASDGLGWEHVSVSSKSKTPSWGIMSYIKSLFWDEEDLVIQFHPRKSDYVNIHNHCLHMWRKIDFDFPTPPKYMV